MSIMACGDCGTVYGPTVMVCPKCGGGNVSRAEIVSGESLPKPAVSPDPDLGKCDCGRPIKARICADCIYEEAQAECGCPKCVVDMGAVSPELQGQAGGERVEPQREHTVAAGTDHASNATATPASGSSRGALREARVHLEWSDRGGFWHPTKFADAVRSCALDHYYDRTNDGVPYGMPKEYQAAFAAVVARHLSAIEPNWKDRTVNMTAAQDAAFLADLYATQQAVAALASDAEGPSERQQEGNGRE